MVYYDTMTPELIASRTLSVIVRRNDDVSGAAPQSLSPQRAPSDEARTSKVLIAISAGVQGMSLWLPESRVRYTACDLQRPCRVSRIASTATDQYVLFNSGTKSACRILKVYRSQNAEAGTRKRKRNTKSQIHVSQCQHTGAIHTAQSILQA